MIDSNFIRENKADILQEIKHEKYLWQGEKNGDNATKYQGRKVKQMAMVLLLVGEALEHEEKILDEETRRGLFYDYVRHYSRQTPSHPDLSGCSGLVPDIIGNLWKML